MSSLFEFFLWLGFMFPLVFSAGPGNLLCAVCGAANGFIRSIPFILGLNVVYFTYSLLAGYGAASIISAYPVLFFYVQLLGAIYIFWLGCKFFNQAAKSQSDGTAPKLRFIDGAISQALNVKGVTIVIAMYSQFLDAHHSLLYEVLSLSISLLLLNLFTHSTWSYGGAWMARNFASPRAVQLQGRIFGLLLCLVSLWLLYRSIMSSQ